MAETTGANRDMTLLFLCEACLILSDLNSKSIKVHSKYITQVLTVVRVATEMTRGQQACCETDQFQQIFAGLGGSMHHFQSFVMWDTQAHADVDWC